MKWKTALVVSCLAVAIPGFVGASAAWAHGPDSPRSPGESRVIKGPDLLNAAGEVVGGSVIFTEGVNMKGVSPRGREYPEGGVWDYGTDFDKGWSNYFHASRPHGATTKQGRAQDRRDVGPGAWANTTLYRAVGGGTMESFWRVND
ncbi:lactococcin 972 family bacteriocin [Nocardia altamirensis]|uniref:lactococcin 972 family bacteriocin n=1 Tax=Nocardia altamirensis TaxID=472158 RepID=UPI000A071E1C